jgi:hypothetical protein
MPRLRRHPVMEPTCAVHTRDSGGPAVGARVAHLPCGGLERYEITRPSFQSGAEPLDFHLACRCDHFAGPRGCYGKAAPVKEKAPSTSGAVGGAFSDCSQVRKSRRAAPAVTPENYPGRPVVSRGNLEKHALHSVRLYRRPEIRESLVAHGFSDSTNRAKGEGEWGLPCDLAR